MNFRSETKPIDKAQNTIMVSGQNGNIINGNIIDSVEIQMIEVGR